jgi:hypothetical protein
MILRELPKTFSEHLRPCHIAFVHVAMVVGIVVASVTTRDRDCYKVLVILRLSLD